MRIEPQPETVKTLARILCLSAFHSTCWECGVKQSLPLGGHFRGKLTPAWHTIRIAIATYLAGTVLLSIQTVIKYHVTSQTEPPNPSRNSASCGCQRDRQRTSGTLTLSRHQRQSFYGGKASKDLRKKVVRFVLCAIGSASAESLVHVEYKHWQSAKPVAHETRLTAATRFFHSLGGHDCDRGSLPLPDLGPDPSVANPKSVPIIQS